MTQPRMTIAELEALLAHHFPEARNFTAIESLSVRTLALRMPFRTALLRAGGTISARQ